MRFIVVLVLSFFVVAFCESIVYYGTTFFTGQEDFSHWGYFVIAVIIDYNIFRTIFNYYLPQIDNS